MNVGHNSAFQCLNKVQRPRYGVLCRVFVHALFKQSRAVGMLSQSARGLSYAVARKFRALKQHLRRVVLNFAVQSAHNSRQSHGLFSVAYNKVVAVQSKFIAVKGGYFLAVFCAADNYLSPVKRPQIERVHRLTKFQQHKVRNIHNIAYRPQSAQRKPFSQPQRGGGGLNVLYIVPYVSGAYVGG